MQVQHSEKTSLLTCLLEGPSGSGKSALAATVAIESGFFYCKIISPESMVGYSEQVRDAGCCGWCQYSTDMVLVSLVGYL